MHGGRKAPIGTLGGMLALTAILGSPRPAETCDHAVAVRAAVLESAPAPETLVVPDPRSFRERPASFAFPDPVIPRVRVWHESALPTLSEKYPGVPGMHWVEDATLLIPEFIKALKLLLMGLEPVGYMRDLVA